jgi:hypothetical protein
LPKTISDGFFFSRPLRTSRLSANQIVDILDDIPSDSDISDVVNDSDVDETFRPRGDEAPSSSEDEPEDVEDVGDVPGPFGDAQDGLLPDIDGGSVPLLPHIPADAQAKRRRVSGKRVVQREWLQADLPVQEMPPSIIFPRGIQKSENEVQTFLKLFGSNNLDLLTFQTNMVRAQTSINKNKPSPPNQREGNQAGDWNTHFYECGFHAQHSPVLEEFSPECHGGGCDVSGPL